MTRRAELIAGAVETWRPGACILRMDLMKGGMSAESWKVIGRDFVVVARFPGESQRLVVEDPATYEFETLAAVRRTGLPAPKPLVRHAGESESLILLEYLEGEATAAPSNRHDYLEQYAHMLAKIHRAPVGDGKFSFLLRTRRRFRSSRSVLDKELREPEIVRRLSEAGVQDSPPEALRHGDFWPGNILWQAGRLTGVIDWENALLGPAIADLSISRLDVDWILGAEAREEFTARYLKHNPIAMDGLAYWDLRAALRPMANLDEWPAPYAALHRPDITTEHLRLVLDDFVSDALRRFDRVS